MNLEEFNITLKVNDPPGYFTELQQAIWYAAKNDWDAAHTIVQQHEGKPDFDRLHAYLHRVEGDEWNANYWYRRAGMTMSQKATKQELSELIKVWIEVQKKLS